jgi:hypothetical protein
MDYKGTGENLYRHLVLEPSGTVEDAINALPSQGDLKREESEATLVAVRIVIACCLLGSELIEPDVLAADRGKPLTDALIDKARRRGKNGWNVGRTAEVSPHWRGPCPLALYWTGSGRQTPVYRYRKGCIVHRGTMPTGYGGHDDGSKSVPEMQ